MLRLILLHVLFCGGEVFQVLVRRGDPIDRNILPFCVEPDSLEKLNNLFASKTIE